MNMGLIMRFMATKSVDEGRKAATFNILFMLPLSAIVVGNAGWIGKAISVADPVTVPPNTSPDQIFVVVANIVSMPGVFGFIMAALTAALMSTVDTLINATAAIYINDVHRPFKKWIKAKNLTDKETDKKELFAARTSSVIITILGVVGVLAFKNFPTVYEAHGYFHSTLTPPLVVAIFLGIFWRRFTPAAVIASFLGGVALMLLGAKYPGILIAPFDHGIEMDPVHPYSYIRALYNLFVCALVAVVITVTTKQQQNIVNRIKATGNAKNIMAAMTTIAVIFFIIVAFAKNIFGVQPSDPYLIALMILLALVMTAFVAIAVTYYVKYDQHSNTEGLTVWSIAKAKEWFKGGKVNDKDGEKVKVDWKLKEGEDEIVNLSKNDMKKMAAEVGDLVYLCDARGYLGGLKSVHAVAGEPHDEDGVVYINNEHMLNGQFVEGRKLEVEKEM